MEAEIPWIQLYASQRAEGADCQSEYQPDERQSPRDYLTKETVLGGSSNREAEPIPDGLVRLFCVGRYTEYIQRPRIVDSKKTPHVHVEGLEEVEHKSAKAHWTRHSERKGVRMGQLTQKLLADFQESGIA